MKPFGFLVRFIVVGIIWSMLFITLWRSTIYEIWGFDAAFNRHWIFLWQMWQDGWVIDTLSEWLFFLAIFLFIPLWLLGWLAFAQIKWGAIIAKALKRVFGRLKKLHKKYFAQKVLVITRKKSYRRTRPPALSYVMPTTGKSKAKAKKKKRKDGKDDAKMREKIDVLSGKKSSGKKKKKTDLMMGLDDFSDDPEMSDIMGGSEGAKDIESLYQSRRNDEVPPWDTTPEEKPVPEPLTEEEVAQAIAKAEDEVKTSIAAKGFELIEGIEADGIKLDMVGIAQDKVLACLIDRAEGDWLADEESFNDEEPLWFSEKTHRVSPVKQLCEAADVIREKLGLGDDVVIENVLAIAGGNVINASDMTEIWDNLGVAVCRIANGTPVTLPHMIEVIPKAEKKAAKSFVSECEKVLKSDDED